MSKASRVDHELTSVDSLVECLKQRFGHRDVRVRRAEDHHDPPDFWLNVDGNRFAVEETSIVDQKTVESIAAARRKGLNHGCLGLKWEGEAQDDLAVLIQNAVSVKRSKLEKMGVPKQCSDIILLLYDAYAYGDAEDAKIALRKVIGYGWFHSIFWAASFRDRLNASYPEAPGRKGSFLYSKDARWDR